MNTDWKKTDEGVFSNHYTQERTGIKVQVPKTLRDSLLQAHNTSIVELLEGLNWESDSETAKDYNVGITDAIKAIKESSAITTKDN